MRISVLLFFALLSGCADKQPDLTKTCFDVAMSSERYPSTAVIIDSEVKTEVKSNDEFASELAGNALNQPSFEDLKSKVTALPVVKVEDIEQYPSGANSFQAQLLKAFVDRAERAEQLGLAKVDLSYDVDNGNGIPERKKASCTIPLSNVEAKEPLFSVAQLAKLEELKRKQFGFDQNVANKAYGCCMTEFAIVDPNLSGVSGGVMMVVEIEAAVRSAMRKRSSEVLQ